MSTIARAWFVEKAHVSLLAREHATDDGRTATAKPPPRPRHRPHGFVERKTVDCSHRCLHFSSASSSIVRLLCGRGSFFCLSVCVCCTFPFSPTRSRFPLSGSENADQTLGDRFRPSKQKIKRIAWAWLLSGGGVCFLCYFPGFFFYDRLQWWVMSSLSTSGIRPRSDSDGDMGAKQKKKLQKTDRKDQA